VPLDRNPHRLRVLRRLARPPLLALVLAIGVHTPSMRTAWALDRDAAVIDLDQAIARAVEHHPGLIAARLDTDAADALRDQAALRPNPTLTFDHQRVPSGNRANSQSLSIPIELGGKRQARIDAADANRRAVTADVDERIAQVRADTIERYFELLSAQDRVELARASIATAQRATDAASRRVQAGRVSPVEEARARAVEDTARIELSQAMTALTGARLRLAALWGAYGQRNERGEQNRGNNAIGHDSGNESGNRSENNGRTEGNDEGTAIVARLPEAAAPPVADLSALVALLPTAPAMQRAQAQIAQREAQLGLERSRAVPETALHVGTGTLIENGWRTNQIGISVAIPIFDRNQGNIGEAAVRVRQAIQQRLALEQSLRAELALNWTRWQNARHEIALARDGIVERASQTLDATTRGFELGKFGFLDVLDAQRTLFAGRAQLLRATAEAWQARADIERLLGTRISDPVAPAAASTTPAVTPATTLPVAR